LSNRDIGEEDEQINDDHDENREDLNETNGHQENTTDQDNFDNYDVSTTANFKVREKEKEPKMQTGLVTCQGFPISI